VKKFERKEGFTVSLILLYSIAGVYSLDFLKEYLDARVLLVTSRYIVNKLRKLVIYSRIDAPSFL
jgi:hypothetical protein